MNKGPQPGLAFLLEMAFLFLGGSHTCLRGENTQCPVVLDALLARSIIPPVSLSQHYSTKYVMDHDS